MAYTPDAFKTPEFLAVFDTINAMTRDRGTEKPHTQLADLKAGEAKLAAQIAIAQAARKATGEKVPTMPEPTNLAATPTAGEINKATTQLKEHKEHLAKEALKTGNTAVFNPPMKPGSSS